MGKKVTEHSRKLRVRAASDHQQKIVASGGRRLAVLLYPPANSALTAEMDQTGESAASVVNRALEGLAQK